MTGTVQGGQDDMELSADDIRRVLEALDASEWDEAVITVGDVRIAVARNGAALTDGAAAAAPAPAPEPAAATAVSAPAPAAAPAPSPAPAAAAADSAQAPQAAGEDRTGATITVEAPSVGVFWRAPEPGAAPFVEVGQRVAKGDTLGIVEVMKLMSHVDAPQAGTVLEIHVDNAQSVEFGTALITIAVDEG